MYRQIQPTEPYPHPGPLRFLWPAALLALACTLMILR